MRKIIDSKIFTIVSLPKLISRKKREVSMKTVNKNLLLLVSFTISTHKEAFAFKNKI